MKYETLWEKFIQSGSVADYLVYSASKYESEMSLSHDNDRGNCS